MTEEELLEFQETDPSKTNLLIRRILSCFEKQKPNLVSYLLSSKNWPHLKLFLFFNRKTHTMSNSFPIFSPFSLFFPFSPSNAENPHLFKFYAKVAFSKTPPKYSKMPPCWVICGEPRVICAAPRVICDEP